MKPVERAVRRVRRGYLSPPERDALATVMEALAEAAPGQLPAWTREAYQAALAALDHGVPGER